MDPLGTFVRRAQAGDLEAFGQLVRATQAMARGVALSVLRDSELAKDAVQDAYLRAFRRIRDLDDPTRRSATMLCTSTRPSCIESMTGAFCGTT